MVCENGYNVSDLLQFDERSLSMFFPYSTDAPIYHWPFATVAMIVACVLVFCGKLADPNMALPLALQTGNGLHPYQWITSNFVHADPMHLVGNMLSLWSFGLVVEGKLGWYKSLAVYFGIGVAQCAVEQTLFLGAANGYSCGASAIIFGMMAMSMVWAPENELNCILLLGWFVYRFDVRIKTVVGALVALQVVIAISTEFTLSTELLHLMGAAVGFGVGVWMLKTGRVDCENWDIFSVRAGRHKMTEEQREEDNLRDPEYRRRRENQLEDRRQELLGKIRTLIRDGHPAVAWAAYLRMTKELAEVALPEADLCALIAAFHKDKLWAESIPAMVEYLARFTARALPMRFKLAKILILESRPMQAIRVMAKIDKAALATNERNLLDKLHAEAVKRHARDPYEVADEDW
ncbi:MAG: rhomboid family intramembrane serine protease [Thermoguttaceae bacterium]|jgi:membrane associated rhomboid family serine protease